MSSKFQKTHNTTYNLLHHIVYNIMVLIDIIHSFYVYNIIIACKYIVAHVSAPSSPCEHFFSLCTFNIAMILSHCVSENKTNQSQMLCCHYL